MKISDILQRENNNLDLVRVILAMMVIIGHTPALNGYSSSWTDPITYFFEYTYSGAFAVKMFFFISGMVVTHSYLKKKDAIYFIVARLFRIVPLLFFVLMITVFVFGIAVTDLTVLEYFSQLGYFSYIIKNLFFHTQYYLPGVFNENVFPSIVNGSLWTLKYEMGCYLLTLFSFLILSKRNPNYLNIPILLIIIDAFFIEGLAYQLLGPNTEKNLLPVSFAFGALLAINAGWWRINIKTVILTFVLFYVFKAAPQNHVFLIIFTSTLITYLSTLKGVLRFKPKYDISYGIYLWGCLIQQTLYHFFGQIHSGLHCIVAILICSILGYFSFIIIERPFTRIGKDVFKRIKENFHANPV